MSERIKPKHNFTQGPLFFRITLFSLPIMATGILQILYNMADNIVVGKYSGDDAALAAVGCTAALTNLIVNLLFGVASGTGVVIAQAWGAKDNERVSRAVHTAMSFSVIGGIAFMLIGLLVSRPALVLMGTNEEILDKADLYLKIICLGIPASSVYNFGASILRSTGDSKTPLYILASTGVVNVVLNLLFVIVFHMTVDGVAIATICAQYLSAVAVVLVLMNNKGESFCLCMRKLAIDKSILLRIFRYGIPTGIQGSFFSISNVMLASAANTFPTTTVSAKTIASNIDGITYTVMNCFSHAAMTFVGQNYGAGKYERAKKAVFYSLIQVVSVGLIISQTELLLGKELAWLFVDKENPDASIIIDTAVEIMKIILSTYFLCGVMEVISGAVRGMGYSLSPMLISLGGVCVFRIFWISVIFPMESMNNLFGLFSVYPVSWILTIAMQSVLLVLAFRKLKRLSLKRDGAELAKKELN